MDDRTDSTRLLTDRQISQRYGLSFHTLRKLRVRGGGPPFIKIGRSVRYRSSDIEAWMIAAERTGRRRDSSSSTPSTWAS